jgi:hypothetical protein
MFRFCKKQLSILLYYEMMYSTFVIKYKLTDNS